MEFVTDLKKEEFDKVSLIDKDKANFFQSYTWGEVAKGKKYKPHYVGIKKNGELIAIALLLEKKIIGKFTFFYAPKAFLIDFQDKELAQFFTKEILKYIKNYNAVYFKINPEIKLHELDADGNVLKNSFDNHSLIAMIESLGYKHAGFNKDFNNTEPRYTFKLKLTSKEEIDKNIHSTTKKILKRGNPFEIEIYKGTTNDIKDFYKIMTETATREKIVIPGIDYYENFYNKLSEQNMSDIYIAKVDINNLKKIHENKINVLETELNSIDKAKYKDLTKYENRINEINNQLSKANKEYDEIKSLDIDHIVLSSIITVKYGNTVWTVHGGNSNELKTLSANYLIYYEIIKDALNEGYKWVDFYGTTGNPVPENPLYGIHLFKKRFGGEYTEFIGDFIHIQKPVFYTLYIKIWPKVRKLLRR